MSYQEYRPSSFNVLPVAVKNLLIINGICFLASALLNSDRFDISAFAIYFPTSDHFRPFQYITYMFMHGSFMHLFSNMFALWMFGSVLENYWGPKRFLTFYFITGIGGALVNQLWTWVEIQNIANTFQQYLQHPGFYEFAELMANKMISLSPEGSVQIDKFISSWDQSKANPLMIAESVQIASDLRQAIIEIFHNSSTVGASGAVFGVLLAFGMLFPNSLLYVFFAIPIKAKYFVILYGLFELYSGITNNSGDIVAHFAHLGGMLFGFILIKYWNKRDRNRFY